ncbi:MAG: hypothetical protein HY231_23695 [Acidobacteria bacterium]|nr:hypothetical protein [Acidobacteriota bacterium]
MRKLTIFLPLFLLAMTCGQGYAQQPTRESLEAKKKQLSLLEPSITVNRNRVVELEAEIKRLNSIIAAQEKTVDSLKGEIAVEAEEVDFLESPARTIVEVTNSKTFLIDFNGNRRLVTSHGLYIESSKETEIVKVFRKKLVKKAVYVRCADALCNQVYIYGDRSGQSLNTEMVKNGLAIAASDARYDLARFSTSPAPSVSSSTSDSPSTNSTPGKEVEVKGYYRKDGTYVRPHTRSAPRRKP